jgi:riboflavin biosynthesis pyrimidine reductase
VDLDRLLRRLGARGISALLIEGGRELITAALRARLVDRLVVCIAPKVIGAGVEAVGDLHIDHMSEALTFARVRVTTVGEDLIFEGQLQHAPR